MANLILSLALYLIPPANAQQAAVAVSSRDLTAEELYQGDNLRDPFAAISARGGASSKKPEGAVSKDPKPHLDRLELSGVMVYPSGRQAIIYDKASGRNFFVKNGQLYDQKNGLVPGISGVVEDKQVILIAAKQTYRLKLAAKDKTRQ